MTQPHFLDWLEPYMDQRMVPPDGEVPTGVNHSSAQKYSPDQPRDEAGRWTSGPSDTVGLHTQMGAWTPERQALHDAILAKAMEGVPTNPSGKPVLYMTGGGYGSGKSTLLDKFPQVVGFPTSTDAVKMDPDAIKKALPEFTQRAAAGDRLAATFVHEESSIVAKDGVNAALASGRDVIYDTSGDTDPDKLAAKVAGYRAAGATEVNANYAFPGSIEEAQARADARAAATDGAMRRYVPPAMLEANHAEVARCWLASANSGTFDNLTLWSTAGPFGEPPTLIASAKGGVTTVADQAQFDNFKALGTEP